jgi:hypothetical protein
VALRPRLSPGVPLIEAGLLRYGVVPNLSILIALVVITAPVPLDQQISATRAEPGHPHVRQKPLT